MTALAAILDRVLGVPDALAPVVAGVEREIADRGPNLDALLDRLPNFDRLDSAAQDEALRELDAAGDETFAALVVAVHERYYADSRTWPDLGYASHVPGRP